MTQYPVLKSSFFKRPSLVVAEELLGKCLVNPHAPTAPIVCITEVEAYIGEDDLASHARFGKTKRNAPMYMQAGTGYVYLIYGIHYCANVVTEETGYPAAILLRAGREYKSGQLGNPITGPGKLCRAMLIDTQYTGCSWTSQSGIHFEDRNITFANVQRTSRIGIKRALEQEWRLVAS